MILQKFKLYLIAKKIENSPDDILFLENTFYNKIRWGYGVSFAKKIKNLEEAQKVAKQVNGIVVVFTVTEELIYE